MYPFLARTTENSRVLYPCSERLK